MTADWRGAGSMRVSGADREAAESALRAHLQAGRLTSTEYEDRSVRAVRAQTWADLDSLFSDLPEPRPAPAAAQHVAQPVARPGPPPGTRHGGVVPEPWAGVIVGLAPLVAVVLFFTRGGWLWFLLIPIVSVLVYGGQRRGGRRC